MIEFWKNIKSSRQRVLITILSVVVTLSIIFFAALHFQASQRPKLVAFQEIRIGDGQRINDGAEVTVDYVLSVRGGKVLLDTHKTGQTFTFIVGAGQVLKGWEDGIRGLREGGKRRIEIPPGLGYGNLGSGTYVPPGATLEVEIELLRIKYK